jgi:FkbM family methyltransferase
MYLRRLLKSIGLAGLVRYTANAWADLLSKQERICVRGGIRFHLDLSQTIDRNIYFGGWERRTISFLKSTLKSGDIVIEVGANVGAHTLLMAQSVLPSGRVYAFEPTEFASKKLRRNLDLNPNLTNVSVHKNLVTNGTHTVPRLQIASSWRSDGKQVIPETVSVPAISIDEFVATNALPSLSLLKIDVDGYDLKVLRGARETILRFRPIIFVELCQYALAEQGDSIQDLFLLMTEIGCRGFDEVGKPLTAESALNASGGDSSINGVFRPIT